MMYWITGIGIYFAIGWYCAETYKVTCANNIEETFEKGAYYVALFLWPVILVMEFFISENRT